MANDLFVERQWKALLQKLRSFPLDWRNDEVNARRLDVLGKEVRLSDLYAACPSLRKRVASHGGLGRLWVASHQWAVDSEAAEVQLPRATQNIDMSQETMWLQLVADMRKFPLSWNAHLHKDLRGALLGRQLHLAQRFARSPGLRRPQGHGDGWCHGDCLWLHEACVLATPEHRAAAEKEHQKLQSIPRLRSFQRLGPELGGAQGPVRRSEPEPAAEDLYTNHVRNLVGTTVAGVIQEPGKDVLVNCFAPWCGHCQRFKPRYQELAKKLSHVQSLVVSQMDCTQNDLGPLRRVVRGYPTIALFPDGRKEDIQLYVGNRSPEDMTKWLHTKVTHAFSDTAPEPPKSEGDSGLLNDDDSNDL